MHRIVPQPIPTLLFLLVQTSMCLVQFSFLLQTRRPSATPRTQPLFQSPCLSSVERIFAISDLHVDNSSNLSWLKQKCQERGEKSPGINDAIIIAGDICHDLSHLKEAFTVIRQGLHCHIFFVPGNHEAWIGGHELESLSILTSIDKLTAVHKLCNDMGIHTEPALLGSKYEYPVWLVPLESWYDGSLSLDGCDDLCQDFQKWPWVDFSRCRWPQEFKNSAHLGKIPIGLADMFLKKNEPSIHKIREALVHRDDQDGLPGIITFSHFLPNCKTLPDWKIPNSEIFQRSEWLSHPVPHISAKFAKVAGSKNLDTQIRSILPSTNFDSTQIHVFGHSHRPKDFIWNGIRYIHNPLGKPVERDMNLIPSDINFKLIWDCRIGNVPGATIIRYWEENGGIRESERMKMRSWDNNRIRPRTIITNNKLL